MTSSFSRAFTVYQRVLHQAYPEVLSSAWHLHISPLPFPGASIDRSCGGWLRGNGDIQPHEDGTSYSGNSGAQCSPRGVSAFRHTCFISAADQMQQYTEEDKEKLEGASLLNVATHEPLSLPPSLSPGISTTALISISPALS